MSNWYNLQKNKCPDCGKLLASNPHEEMIFCNDLNCGFQISAYRMERLITQMNKDTMNYIARDNFSDLQNLGRQPLEEEEFGIF